ncbi:16S rRNA (guanine(966)-N(2))-methyltransferase RsmD [Acaryochloris marina]|uniref:Methyltransferase, putative n=1 Tax=Acaryochloris marina (strain MBIC 11017) TaxID=329726 RepID=B0BYQ0_ACAM1|nr:16S rRNA (guanine(966)-N(2))-methyltransferase RsmD [Acaryochloris marina]ABW27066.1 methyltransferase, putative [Acaryochloris marina MBIC11017]BDM81829.1 16S rRNA (guanine(966)-N(2))-methyltransferase RsmD [Acaryochloris marina MBIC10699]
MVRIYGNRQIKTLPGLQTRPTTARVREALFNRWQHHLQGCHWLDLCAGFGSMGAEALCREAAVVYGIEQAGEACRIIRQNWQSVARPAQTFQVLRGDVVKRLAKLQSQSFDRIYFDPPYDGGLYGAVLDAISTHNLLKATGELAVEHRPKQQFPIPTTLQICHTSIYGNTALTFFQISQLA